MTDLNQAINIALDYTKGLYTNASYFSVEETENEKENWIVTISFRENIHNSMTEENQSPAFYNTIKKYKEIIINKKTGEVESMKIKVI